MLIVNSSNTHRGDYEGFTTNLLIGELNSGSKEISIQITEVEVSGSQFLHRHEQEQCYYIISGVGMIMVDGETRKVEQGDAILIPPNAEHGIENIGESGLVYLTANRSFGKERELEIWPID